MYLSNRDTTKRLVRNFLGLLASRMDLVSPIHSSIKF